MRNPHKQENRPTSACVMARCIATAPKTAEERLYTLARGWLAYPVTPGAHIAIAEIIILVLYNRSSAVDYYSSTDPQVGKPTWGYDYTTALRRLPSPSDCHHHRPQKTAEERFHMLARGWLAYPVTPMRTPLPPKSGCINTHRSQRSPKWESPKNKVSDCETAAGNCLDLDFDFLSSILL